VVRGWLSMTYAGARPLAAARVPPDVLTLVGLLVACAVVPLAAAGGRWPVLGAAVAAASGLLDNLDGAVAVLTGRTTRWGAVLDAAADRVADAAYCVALWALGAQVWLVALAGGLAWLLEYVRARAVGAGMPDAGAITVAERPSRVAGAAMFLLACGVHPSSAATWATVGAWLGVAVGVIGLVQLLVAVRRALT
jgi:CDP-diacylglycerol--glycerol-3-phosphate 3-phosphatidyltransferase